MHKCTGKTDHYKQTNASRETESQTTKVKQLVTLFFSTYGYIWHLMITSSFMSQFDVCEEEPGLRMWERSDIWYGKAYFFLKL